MDKRSLFEEQKYKANNRGSAHISMAFIERGNEHLKMWKLLCDVAFNKAALIVLPGIEFSLTAIGLDAETTSKMNHSAKQCAYRACTLTPDSQCLRGRLV